MSPSFRARKDEADPLAPHPNLKRLLETSALLTERG